LDLTSVAIKALVRAEAEGSRDGLDSFYFGWGVPPRWQPFLFTFSTAYWNLPSPVRVSAVCGYLWMAAIPKPIV